MGLSRDPFSALNKMKSQVRFQLEVDLQLCKMIFFPEVFPMYFLQNNVSLTWMQQPEDISPLEVLLSFTDQLIEGKDIPAVNNHRFFFFKEKSCLNLFIQNNIVGLFFYLFIFISFYLVLQTWHSMKTFFFLVLQIIRLFSSSYLDYVY